ncbi:MAG: ATP-dependent DNA helicase RecG [Rikenellaceae bacterium]|nr:ATP-dependent DNA helicase RecG [Rikenellaceae bacterium]MCL2692191.1 ATP-dependent DNA helicase RecG [Rikenellaceae bacterium]
MESYLDNDIKFLPGVGERRAMLLRKELGIATMRDLLYYFPHRYVDRTKVHRIADITEDSAQTYIQLRARVESVGIHGDGRKRRIVALVSDGSGTAELVWFAGLRGIEKRLEAGREYIIFGRPGFFNNELSIVHPEMESPAAVQKRPSAMQGVYGTTETLTGVGLGAKGIYALVCTLWELAEKHIAETLPEPLMRSEGLMPLREALRNIHFPENPEALGKAQYRLKFEELFGIQLGVVSQRVGRLARGDGFVFARVGERFNAFYNGHLPFELTEAQKRVLKEIHADAVSGRQMNRLLQGDVGSGKTLVALMSMLLAADNGYQSCIMAPTEILARQHFATFRRLLGDLPVRVELLTGSTTAKQRRTIHEGLADGSVDILVGTHALVEDAVRFERLGFVVIDEQHRFGVEQRSRLWTKNRQPPHVLVMTATPIPRTLAMTLYGDLDVSVIDVLPPGRKPVKTFHQRDSDRLRVFGFLRDQIAAGRQVYVVYPLITGSEKMDYKDLEDGFNALTQQFPPPDYHVTVVHGRLRAAVKEENMQTFKSGVAHIMVATSVIEVGVDVPNASVMVIESAERFGLSQLHQLRGRVGRGAEQSYCILMSGDKLSREARERLSAMVRTNDGFELSELDLRLRGSGDLTGTQQSGIAFDLKIANLGRDSAIVERAREAALAVLNADPALSDPLLATMRQRYSAKKEIDFSLIS